MKIQINKDLILENILLVNNDALIEESFIDSINQTLNTLFDKMYRTILTKETMDNIVIQKHEELKRLKYTLESNGLNTDQITQELKSKMTLDGKLKDLDIIDIMKEFLEDLKHITTDKILATVIITLFLFIVHTLLLEIITALFLVSVKGLGVHLSATALSTIPLLLLAVLVAPFTEEATKRISNEYGNMTGNFVGFNIAEFGTYFVQLTTAGLPVFLVVIARTMSSLMHLTTTIIHKHGEQNQMLNDEYKIANNINFKNESQKLANVLHMFWNLSSSPLIAGLVAIVKSNIQQNRRIETYKQNIGK